jgi:autophagy-related protein 17
MTVLSAQEWDLQRTQRTQALDAMLDVLSTQVVPPDFHQPRVEDDVFGPPEADDDPFMTGEQSMNGHVNGSSEDDALSSPATIRGELPPLVSQNMSRMDIRRRQRQDRTRWKTLRDFVDERGIEDALEKMEVERSSLEDLLLSTSDFPGTIEAAIFSIREGVPVGPSKAQPLVQEVIEQQESASAAMATHLESLAVHFDQVEAVLRDSEAGEIIGEEDTEG